MSELEVITVIRTHLLRKGLGASEADPIRRIEQWWDMKGNLLFEYDPSTNKTTRFDPNH